MDPFFPLQAQATVVFHQVMMTLQKCRGSGLGFFWKQPLVWPARHRTAQQWVDFTASLSCHPLILLYIQHWTWNRETPVEEEDDQWEALLL